MEDPSKQNRRPPWISLEAFMAYSLYHTERGYYTRGTPLGRDFTTSPEISQVFGELIGLWSLDQSGVLESQRPFCLVECGPGRGLLMADALRAIGQISPQVRKNLHVVLVEISPALQEVQKSVLKPFLEEGWHIEWQSRLSRIAPPPQSAVVVVANEFFDALPIRQFVYRRGQWHESGGFLRHADGAERFDMATRPVSDALLAALIRQVGEEENLATPFEGFVWEYAPEMRNIAEDLKGLRAGHRFAGVFIDYGYEKARGQETFQGMRLHKPSDPTRAVGKTDLTAHVCFGRLRFLLESRGIRVSPLADQREWLLSLGYAMRCRKLLEGMGNPADRRLFKEGAARLVDPGSMGTLFKVLTIPAADNF